MEKIIVPSSARGFLLMQTEGYANKKCGGFFMLTYEILQFRVHKTMQSVEQYSIII